MSDLEYTNTLNKTVLTPRLIFFNQNVIFAIQNSWRKLDTFCAQIFLKKNQNTSSCWDFQLPIAT